MTIRTWAEIKARITINFFGNETNPDYLQIMDAMEYAYSNSVFVGGGDSLQVYWNRWLDNHPSNIEINFEGGTPGYVPADPNNPLVMETGIINIDPSQSVQFQYITPTGVAVLHTLRSVLLHELELR
jgi:hypothetical protein